MATKKSIGADPGIFPAAADENHLTAESIFHDFNASGG
jgi:hypothetical protein